MNGWGSSIMRPIALGVAICIGFAVSYCLTENLEIAPALIKSFEILLLFGYTNHTTPLTDTEIISLLPFLNAVSGLVWYAVTIPTIVNKLTRIRG